MIETIQSTWSSSLTVMNARALPLPLSMGPGMGLTLFDIFNVGTELTFENVK